MKKSLTKFLTLLGVFLFLGAGQANADYYFRNAQAGWNSNNNNYKFTYYDSDGGFNRYRLEIQNLQGGYFDLYENNEKFGVKKNNTKEIGVGGETYYAKGNENSGDAANITGNPGHVYMYITVYDDGYTLKVRIEQVQSVQTTYQFNGDFWGTANSWADPAPAMTQSGNEWKITLTAAATSGKFGIKEMSGSSQQNYYKGGETLNYNRKLATLTNDGSAADAEIADMVVGNSYTFTWNPTNKTISVSGTFEQPVTTVSKWYLNGQMFGTGGWEKKELTSNGDGTYSITWDVSNQDGEYTIYGDDIEYKVANNNQENKLFVGNGAITLNKNNSTNGQYGLSAGKYTFIWTPAADNNSGTLRVEPYTISFPVSSTSVFIKGKGYGLDYENDFSKYEPKEVKKGADGNYTFTIRGLEQFKVSRSNNPKNWDEFNANTFVNSGDLSLQQIMTDAGQKVSLNKSNDDIKLPSKRTYTVTISSDFETMTVKATPVKYWALYGQVFDNTNQYYRLMQSEEEDEIWTGSFLTDGSGQFQVVYHQEKASGTNATTFEDISIYGNGNLTETNNSLTLASNGRTTFELSPNTLYTFKWNSKTNKLSIAESNSLYIYGHIGRGSWDRANGIELRKTSAGVYEVNNVEFWGEWNGKDVALDGSRGLYDDTDICYFAFYPTKNTATLFDDTGSNVWKFGSNPTYNNYDGGTNLMVNRTEGQKDNTNADFVITAEKNGQGHIKFQTEKQENNFVVKKPSNFGNGEYEGFYNVKFDFNQSMVFLSPGTPVKEREYVWFFGDDDNENVAGATALKQKGTSNENEVEMPHYTHNFKASDTEKNVVQVGIGTVPTHPAARQVHYTIGYKGNYKSATPAPKRRINGETVIPEGFEIVGETDMTYDPDNNGTYEDKDGNIASNVGLVTIIGSSAPDDNHLIKLNQVGQYYIVAEIEDDHTLAGYEVSPASLLATVSTGSVILDINGSSTASDDTRIRVPFNTMGEITKTQIFSFKSESGESLPAGTILEIGKDVAVEITPQNTENWEKIDDYGDESNVALAYWNALNINGYDSFENDQDKASLYQQWHTIQGFANTKEDGFYRGWSDQRYSVDLINNTGNIVLKPQCSGIYLLTFKAIGTNYTFADRNIEIEVYPNLTGKFGNDMGFNIDGYTFEATSDGIPTIKVPQEAIDNWKKWNKEKDAKLPAYIPGTYFVDTFIETTEAEDSNSGPGGLSFAKRKAGEASPKASNYYTKVDLSSLDGNTATPHEITVYVEKNGASQPYKFSIENGTGAPTTTGVEAIGSEEGEAVYYNLQGVKVENPEHGIYVKVVNGKATKVVL